jgi:hypothetical protein
MSEPVTTVSNWFQMEDEITHWCGGTTDEKKGNKPKETQIAATNWFNPTLLDEETKVRKCSACGAEYKVGDPLTNVGGS